MGKVHKKKLAKYNNSPENDENKNKSKGSDSEKSANNVSDKDSNDENVSNDSIDNKNAEEDLESSESNDGGKKSNKRKIANKKRQTENGGSDEEVESSNGNSGAKKAKKLEKSASKKIKGKVPQKEADADDSTDIEEVVEEYEVKNIIDHKVENGVSYFLIRWKGYSKNDDTWEAEDALSCSELIEQFKNKRASAEKDPKKKLNVGKKVHGQKAKKPAPDPNQEWEVEKIIDYANEKNGRVFRIRWKGYGVKHDTWEPESNLSCDDLISKFMERMKSQENITFKQLREEPKKTKRLVNETAPRENFTLSSGRKSKRSVVTKKRIYYGDSDE